MATRKIEEKNFFGWKQKISPKIFVIAFEKNVFLTWIRIRIGNKPGSGSELKKLDPYKTYTDPA